MSRLSISDDVEILRYFGILWLRNLTVVKIWVRRFLNPKMSKIWKSTRFKGSQYTSRMNRGVGVRGFSVWPFMSCLLLCEYLSGPLVGLLNSVLVQVCLLIDPVQLSVLTVYFVAHVRRHVFQICDHSTHCINVFLHLVLASVICDPKMQNCILLVSLLELFRPENLIAQFPNEWKTTNRCTLCKAQ